MSSPEQPIDPTQAQVETAQFEREQTPEERERAETTRLFLENLERNLKIEIYPGDPSSEQVNLLDAGLVTMSLAGQEESVSVMKAAGQAAKATSAERAAITQQYVDRFLLQDTLPTSLSEKTIGQAKIKPSGPEEQHNTWTGKKEAVDEYNYRRHSASPRGQLRLAQELVHLSAYQTLLAREKIPFGAQKSEANLTPRQEAIVNGYERTLERIFEGNPSDPNSRVPERIRGVARETIRSWESDTQERLTAQPATAPELPPVVEVVAPEAPEVTAQREAGFLQKVIGTLRDNPELTKQLGLATVDAVARITGLKGYVDVPRYVVQRFAVHGFMGRGGIEAKMREALAAEHGRQAAREKGEGEEAAQQRLEAAQAKLEKTMRYIRQDIQVEGQPGTYRELAQKILQEHADAAQSNRLVFEVKTKELLDRYTATKIDGVAAAREGLNSLLVASGAFGVRALTSGVLEIAQRSRAIERERKMAGNEKPVDLVKDVIWDSAVKNYRELVQGGGQSTRGARNLTRAQAAMKIARWAGIAASVEGIGVGDMRIFDHVGTAAGNAWEVAKAPVSGVGRLIDGFTGKAEWGTIGHELVNKIGSVGGTVAQGAETSLERIGHTFVVNAQAAEHGVEAGWDWSMRQLGLSPEDGKAVLESSGVVVGAAAETKGAVAGGKPVTAGEKLAPVGAKTAAAEAPKPTTAESARPAGEGGRPERLTAQQIRERAQRNPEAFAKTLERAQQTLGKQFPEVQKALNQSDANVVEQPAAGSSRVKVEVGQEPSVPEAKQVLLQSVSQEKVGSATVFTVVDATGHKGSTAVPLPEGTRIDFSKDGKAEIFARGRKLYSGTVRVDPERGIVVDYGKGPQQLHQIAEGLQGNRIETPTAAERSQLDAKIRPLANVDQEKIGPSTYYFVTDAEGHKAGTTVELPEDAQITISKDGRADIYARGRIQTGAVSVDPEKGIVVDYGKGPRPIAKVVEDLRSDLERQTPSILPEDQSREGSRAGVETSAAPEEHKIRFSNIEKTQFGTASFYKLTDAEGHAAEVNLALPEGGRVDIFEEGRAEVSVQGHKLFTGQVSIEGDTVMIDYGKGPKELKEVVSGLWAEAQRINRSTPSSLRTDLDAAGRTIDGAIDWLFGTKSGD